MLWALMPEAAVDEDGDLGRREHEVDLHRDPLCTHAEVLPKAEAVSMDIGANPLLWPRVDAAIGHH